MGIFDFLTGKNNEEEKGEVVDEVLPEELQESSSLELQDVIAPSALKVGSRNLNLGEKVSRTFFVISYPQFLPEGWFSSVVNLDRVFDISLFVHPIDTEKVMKKFRKKVAEVESQINRRAEKG